jgi:diguanylate cyclase (GGDEF)-like protein
MSMSSKLGACLRPVSAGLVLVLALILGEAIVDTFYAWGSRTMYQSLTEAEPYRWWLRGFTSFLILIFSCVVGLIMLRQHNIMAALSEKNLELQNEVSLRKKMEVEFTRLTVTDMLTGIGNRRKFECDLSSAISTERRNSRGLYLFMCDIDHFKKINDSFGHDVGDRVLTHLAKLWSEALRENDTIYRIGGEEFVILSYCSSWDGARSLAVKLARALESADFSPVGVVTTSIGVAQLSESDTSQSFYKRADEALYEAKVNGRNQFRFNRKTA